MSKAVLVTTMLLVGCALNAGAQVSVQQLAIEAQIKANSPYAAMRAETPSLTLQDYNAAVRARAKQELAKAPLPAAPATPRSVVPVSPLSARSTRIDPFTFSRFHTGVTGTRTQRAPFHFSHFSTGVSGRATTFEPFTFQTLSDQRGEATTAKRTTAGDFQFHFNEGKHCTTTTLHSFPSTHCY